MDYPPPPPQALHFSSKGQHEAARRQLLAAQAMNPDDLGVLAALGQVRASSKEEHQPCI